MMPRIEVRRVHSELREDVWRFWFNDSEGTLVLDFYQVLTRATKRHKWIIADYYSRTRSRDASLKIDDVPWDEEIAREAKDTLFQHIRVVKQYS